MKKHLISGALLLTLFSASAQKLHDASEIFKIIAESKICYVIDPLKSPLPEPNYSENLLDNACYRVETDSTINVYRYEVNKVAQEYFKQAESVYQSTPEMALDYYKLALEADSSFYQVMTYIGQMYENKKQMDLAIEWYQKAIQHNYIDYLAHWFLADAYFHKGRLSEAVDEIVLARILNRNNPRIKASMDRILRQTGRKVTDWYFNPQVQLTELKKDSIRLQADKHWLPWALGQAAWHFEPGYSDSMGVKPNTTSLLEYKECMLCMVTYLANAKINTKKDVPLRTMQQATDNRTITEFILYEIILPQKPYVARNLNRSTLLALKDYILDVRHPLKK